MLLCACGEVAESKDFTSEENNRFAYVKEYTYGENDYFRILVDKETRVMYLYMYSYNCCSEKSGLTVMLNADGTPMLWDGDL